MMTTIKIDLIKKFIEENGFCIKNFCERCNISKFVFNKILKDDPKVKLSSLKKVASFMGLNTWDLLNE